MGRTTALGVQVSESLFERMNVYLESPVAAVRSKRELVSRAIEEFLDREEPLAEELLLVRNSLRKKSRVK